jgi:transcription elongation factor GreA-like protein/transcription elongation GreA/GreB family factor
MGYLEDFLTQIQLRDFSKFLQLWEEYCASDQIEPEEITQLLEAVKKSEFARPFGQMIETALPLIDILTDKSRTYDVLRHLIDLQVTNSPKLADIATQALKDKYETHPMFNERIRLVGLRSRDQFQGALSNFDLLAHLDKGAFVYHESGWGVGEILEISQVREQIGVEFENVSGVRHITFTNAFKNLIPVQKDNFRVRRFAFPDDLEAEAKKDPVGAVKLLLRDLGPKTAAEIKDELCEWVIPEADWTKWWQSARGKLKKDTMVETPSSVKDPFRLRKSAVSHSDQFKGHLTKKTDLQEILLAAYNFVRDNPKSAKEESTRKELVEKLQDVKNQADGNISLILGVELLLESLLSGTEQLQKIEELIRSLNNPEEVVDQIQIAAYKKRALGLIKEYRTDWIDIFLNVLFSPQQGLLRDYLLDELLQGPAKAPLLSRLEQLFEKPAANPDMFVWYFQKVTHKGGEKLPYGDKAGQCTLFEGFLILFSQIEPKPEYKDLVKKMASLLSNKRYALVRTIIEGTSLEYIHEFLLLISKIQTLTDTDQKILSSLAEVVQPSLSTSKQARVYPHTDPNIYWTTEESYLKVQDKIKQIGTKEIVENAREIEAARALGDLRENSEFKFALEKRSRLQGELKRLSDQFRKARVISKNDVHETEVGVGCVVELRDSKGSSTSYKILGPWDADPDHNILSLQSKLAQAMAGLAVGDKFEFRDEEYTIAKLSSIFD